MQDVGKTGLQVACLDMLILSELERFEHLYQNCDDEHSFDLLYCLVVSSYQFMNLR